MNKILSAILTLALVSICLVAFPSASNANTIPIIKLTSTDVSLFDESLQEEMLVLSKNTIVIVLSEANGWAKVQYKSNTGYIESIQLKNAAAKYMLVQSKNEPLLRVTNAQNSDIKGKLPLNSIVEVYSNDSSSYAFVQYGHLAGYVNKHALVKPNKKPMLVNEQSLVVRKSASPSSTQIGQLAKDTQAMMLTNLNGWAFVTSKDLSGYVQFKGLKDLKKLPPKASTEPDATKPVTPNGKKKIALTFDDGPHPKVTPQILKTLKKYDAKATFFVVGDAVKKHPEVLKEVYNAGHEIGNHTYNHAKLTTLSVKQIQGQIRSTDAAVKMAVGQTPTVFRPPYGAYNKTITNQLKVPNVLWTIDTLDWKHHDPKKTLQSVKTNSKNGSIILMHDIHQTTADALDAVLAHLQKQDYEFVTVSELLKSE